MNRIQQEKEFWNTATDEQLYDDWLTDKTYDIVNGCVSAYKPKQVLEVGSGNGRLLNRLGRQYPTITFLGIDIAEEQLIKVLDNSMPLNCMYKLCDGRSIPKTNRLYDMVFCITVFQHLPLEAVAIYIREVSNVLAPYGRFLFQFIEGTEDEPFSKHFNLLEIYQLVRDCNFGINKCFNAVHEKWTWVEAIKK